MASDLISERRDEWQEALDDIVPQIRGLEDKINDALSEELRAVLNERLAFLRDRFNLINSAIAGQDAADAAEDALEDHGFPELPDMQIDQYLLDELDREVADNLAARDGFAANQMATNMSINLGAPVRKP